MRPDPEFMLMARAFATMAQDGSRVKLRVGDTLTVELGENPTTGYRWAFDQIDGERVAIEDSAFRGTDQPFGGGGAAVWTLRARASGQTRIALKRWRAWEGAPSIIERFSLTLDIASD